ncbi:MAG: DUF222 domain-containing protein [Actinomycetota bacterium]|nr:DUF222 domain-containing protein [Actinomycetota bacterium]
MFEVDAEVLTTGRLAALVAGLGRLDASVDDAERVEQIRLLEQLKAAAGAAQARVTAGFVTSQRATQRAAGVPAEQVGRGIAAQVGLARRESPARANRYTGWAQLLVAELPATLAALQAGQTSEWRAMIVARETGWLSREHRAAVDTALADQLGRLGDHQVEAETKKLAYRLDPHGYLARIRGAQRDRRVSLRPAPEVMSRLTALIPTAQGVAAYAALVRHADSLRAQGDPRSRGQLMADTLVERVTGQAAADSVPVEVDLVMTDTTLFNLGNHDHPDPDYEGEGEGGADPRCDADEPAQLNGYGPIPAELARRLVLAADDTTAVWVRRLYRHPDTGALVAMDSRRRLFPTGLRRFLVLRDQTCRTPWCDAPVRHTDHVVAADDGGPTSADNGQGTCEACNQVKQMPGWQARAAPHGAGHVVNTTTPTGHTYTSRAPDPPGAPPPRPDPSTASPPSKRSRIELSRVEAHFRDLIDCLTDAA